MSARSLAIRAVLVAVLFVAVVLLLGGLVPGARERLSDADAGWLAVAVALELVACFGYAALFYAVFARPPILLRARRSTQIALAELGGFAKFKEDLNKAGATNDVLSVAGTVAYEEGLVSGMAGGVEGNTQQQCEIGQDNG